MSQSLPYSFDELKPLREKSSDEYVPDEQQIIEYADYIGIELPGEEFLLPLAKEGITAHLPLEWQACSAPDGQIIYRNLKTKKIQQQHPLDELYRSKVKKQRKKLMGIASLLRNQKQSQVQAGQQEGQYEFYYDEGDLITIPQEKSSEQSFSKSQNLQQIAHPSQQMHSEEFASQELYKDLSNPLKPESGSSLLNNGMYMFSSDGLSEQFTSKDLISKTLNNKSNLSGYGGFSEFQSRQQNTHANREKTSKESNIKHSDKKGGNQRMEHLQRLKGQIERMQSMKKVKQQLLLQIRGSNQLKSQKIRNNLIKNR